MCMDESLMVRGGCLAFTYKIKHDWRYNIWVMKEYGIVDSNGRINEEYQSEESIQGNDVVLTIDANLQEATEKAMLQN